MANIEPMELLGRVITEKSSRLLGIDRFPAAKREAIQRHDASSIAGPTPVSTCLVMRSPTLATDASPEFRDEGWV